eukprot:UN4923
MLCEWLGGGDLHMEELPINVASVARSSVRRGFAPLRRKFNRCQELEDDGGLFTELWPPSRIVYFRPVKVRMWFCGVYEVATKWTAEWAEPEDLHELILAARSVELHFPNIIKAAYRNAAVSLEAVDYNDGSSTVSHMSEVSSLRSDSSQ